VLHTARVLAFIRRVDGVKTRCDAAVDADCPSRSAGGFDDMPVTRDGHGRPTAPSKCLSARAMVLYTQLAVIAAWLPTLVAALTTATWIAWLVISLRAKHT
jgi:hypothetical protein